MVRNLRNLFQRATPTEGEINTLHGVIVALLGKRDKRAAREKVDARMKRAKRAKSEAKD
jgi:tRNA C32,U32 (ribose-2'-O)-methylase TrmJ